MAPHVDRRKGGTSKVRNKEKANVIYIDQCRSREISCNKISDDSDKSSRSKSESKSLDVPESGDQRAPITEDEVHSEDEGSPSANS